MNLTLLRKRKGDGTFLKENNAERFFRAVKKIDSGCWEWQGGLDQKGYGNFNVSVNEPSERRIKQHHHKAHRFSWFLKNGDIPDGMMICHRCDNPSCQNPEHYFLGTNNDNIADKVSKRRQSTGDHRKMIPKGSEHGSAKLIESDVVKIRDLRVIAMPAKVV
jgi:hypothetical protein